MALADATPAASSERLRAVNRRTEAMLQIPRSDLVGHRLCEVPPINRTGGFFEKYRRVAETGTPLEEEFLLPDTAPSSSR
jgi:hypothetical protein